MRVSASLVCPGCKACTVIIDVCKGHGVWFEQNELSAALRFIESGGFERARIAEGERQAEERTTTSLPMNVAGEQISLA